MNIKDNNFLNNDVQCLELKITGFLENDLTINEAGKYDLKLKNGVNFSDLINIIISTKKQKNKKEEYYNIFLNDFSVKNDYLAKRFLQQNTLILEQNMLLIDNLTVKENLKIVSLMFLGYDLSDACLSSFLIKDIKDKKVCNLTINQKKMLILSYTVCSSLIIWFIDCKLLNGLSKDELSIFENAVKIRVKHGGIVLIVKYTKSI